MQTKLHTRFYKGLMVVLLMAVTLPSRAYDFMVDGLAYNVNEDGTSVTLTFERTASPSYSNLESSIIIPGSVTYNGTTYSVTIIGENTFYDCQGLTSVTIPNSITLIGDNAFKNCTGLTSLTIPNSVIAIGNYAFNFCSELKSVEIPNSVKTIGNGAFEYCSELITVTIPNSVTSIGSNAFTSCYRLNTVTLGKSVTSIGSYVFSGCNYLKSIKCKVLNPLAISLWNNAFQSIPSSCVLNVPKGTSEIYQSLPQWDGFAIINEFPFEPGDVNYDEECTAYDVTVLYNFLLNNDNSSIVNGDINDDGLITAADITMIYNILLGNLDDDTSTITEFTVYGVSFKMVKIDGGKFMMGATQEQGNAVNSDEYPVHQVTLTKTYYIGMTEVTQELWNAVMGYNPSVYNGGNYGTNLQRPVEYISWNECQEFIAKLNEKTGKNFRLPTEAEWEFAARGGDKSGGYKYSGSNTIDDVAWYCNDIPSQTPNTEGYGTQTVATKHCNELGIFDMSGNVNEWCQDQYGYYSSEPQIDPTGATESPYRVVRGGNWFDSPRDCRVSSRRAISPAGPVLNVGLRLAM